MALKIARGDWYCVVIALWDRFRTWEVMCYRFISKTAAGMRQILLLCWCTNRAGTEECTQYAEQSQRLRLHANPTFRVFAKLDFDEV